MYCILFLFSYFSLNIVVVCRNHWTFQPSPPKPPQPGPNPLPKGHFCLFIFQELAKAYNQQPASNNWIQWQNTMYSRPGWKKTILLWRQQWLIDNALFFFHPKFDVVDYKLDNDNTMLFDNDKIYMTTFIFQSTTDDRQCRSIYSW